MIRKLSAALLGASTLFAASAASAQDAPATTTTTTTTTAPAATTTTTTSDSPSALHPISVGLLVGYGINNEAPSSANQTFNAYGLGFGVRAGYTLPMKVYLGATFIYHLGFDKDLGGGVKATGRVSPLGVEGGYDFDITPQITIRPYLGLGLALYSSTATVTVLGQSVSVDNGGSKFALWPGVTAMYNVSDNIFLGVDARYTIVTGVDTNGGGSPNAIGFYFNPGMRF